MQGSLATGRRGEAVVSESVTSMLLLTLPSLLITQFLILHVIAAQRTDIPQRAYLLLPMYGSGRRWEASTTLDYRFHRLLRPNACVVLIVGVFGPAGWT